MANVVVPDATIWSWIPVTHIIPIPKYMDPRGWIPGWLSGGVTVAVAGLPSVIALGVLAATPFGSSTLASGVVAALVAAIFGGMCAAFISRTPGEVSAPDISLSIVYASLCADLLLRNEFQLAAGEVIAALSLAVVPVTMPAVTG